MRTVAGANQGRPANVVVLRPRVKKALAPPDDSGRAKAHVRLVH